ncbi:MAG: hypothetical protein WBC91_23185 [Phototrophicaceae bacterium]
MLDNLGQWLQWLFLLGCVLPLIVTIILAGLAFYFGRQWVSDFLEPDLPKLQETMQAIKAKNPTINDDALIAKIVHRQALKCGLVGAVTGFGGFVTLPITLPVDLLLTARYQATMVSFVAQVHGFEESLENKAATYAVMTGSTEITQVTTAVMRKYIPRIVGTSFSKLIPVLGAVFGFVVNYFMARSMASAATLWYRSTARDVVIARLGVN